MRVLTVSASALARAGMAGVLAAIPGATVIGSVTGEESADRAAGLQPDLVLFDAGLGGERDVEAITRLTAEHPAIPVVVLSAVAGQLNDLLAAGAAAVLPSEVDAETLGAALEAAVHGLLVIARADSSMLVPAGEPVSAVSTPPIEALTPREQEVLQGMAGGLTNRQIAHRLRISEHTVKFHAAAVLGKLGARSRTEAVARAMQRGMILV